MTIELDELLYNALIADEALMTAVCGRITSTCFEVSPEEQDNTPVPCIIVTDDGLSNEQPTKDDVWESSEDRVQASVEVDGVSPKEVKQLIRKVRKAIANYIKTLSVIPDLQSVTTNGIAWDWTKPCYHSTVSYTCIVDNDLDNEQD